MKFPVSISEMKPCDCFDSKPNWKVVEIKVDDKLEERFRQLPSNIQKRIEAHHDRIGKPMAKKLYLLTIQCIKCRFSWTKYVLDKQLIEEERVEKRLEG